MRELAELLLDAPAGIKLYCPVWGEVVFQGISDDINVLTDKGEFDGSGRNGRKTSSDPTMSSPAMRVSSSTSAPSTTTSYQPIT